MKRHIFDVFDAQFMELSSGAFAKCRFGKSLLHKHELKRRQQVSLELRTNFHVLEL